VVNTYENMNYVKEEINELASDPSFQLNESSSATLGDSKKAQGLVRNINVVDSSQPMKRKLLGIERPWKSTGLGINRLTISIAISFLSNSYIICKVFGVW